MRFLTCILLLAALSCSKNTYYREPYRPQFHFSPAKNWMNDPNGLVYYEGEYHLFYQYHPYSNVWGPMHWGHAVSKDLVHWQHLPIALEPDKLGTIFSGSAAIDWKNTSGFGKNGVPPMVAMFTYHDAEGEKKGRDDFQTQGIAYSLDKGRTWTKYAGNPVLPNAGVRDFRDPKIRWDAERAQWLVVLAAQQQLKLYTSPDLKNWTWIQDFGAEWGNHRGVWECPDFFPMKIDGSEETKWVLLENFNPGMPNGGSGCQYFIGDFDGKKFVLDEDFRYGVANGRAIYLDHGRDNYAGVTWSDVPAQDGRRLLIGWMSNWDYATKVPTDAWRSANTLPRQLTLRNTAFGLRLFTHPIKELEKLREGGQVLRPEKLRPGPVVNNFAPSQMELILEFELPARGEADFGLELLNAQGERYRLGYSSRINSFYSDRRQAGQTLFTDNFAKDRHYAPRPDNARKMTWHVFFDHASMEIFADDGRTVMTEIFFPSTPFSAIHWFVNEGEVQLKSGQVYGIKSIWRK
jgi:fructan beta-fructosidase